MSAFGGKADVQVGQFWGNQVPLSGVERFIAALTETM
jgi:hypothetical protein